MDERKRRTFTRADALDYEHAYASIHSQHRTSPAVRTPRDVAQRLMHYHISNGTAAMAAIVLGWVAASTCLAQPAAAGGRPAIPTEDDVATQVRQRIAARLPDNIDTIIVESSAGGIRLFGTVDMFSKRQIATEAAEGVAGVTSVINVLSVDPERRTDDQITIDAQAALEFDSRTASADIDVSANDGVVTLRGLVKSIDEKQAAATLAGGVRGVRDLKNEIRVAPSTRPDAQIRAELARHFAESPLFNDNRIVAQVSEGAVSLAGHVDNIWERKRAESDAWIAGVRHVDVAELRVNPDRKQR